MLHPERTGSYIEACHRWILSSEVCLNSRGDWLGISLATRSQKYLRNGPLAGARERLERPLAARFGRMLKAEKLAVPPKWPSTAHLPPLDEGFYEHAYLALAHAELRASAPRDNCGKAWAIRTPMML
jgi:hypothetical protein